MLLDSPPLKTTSPVAVSLRPRSAWS